MSPSPLWMGMQLVSRIKIHQEAMAVHKLLLCYTIELLPVLLYTTYCIISLTIASADYTSKSVDLMFGPSSRKQCVLIPVLNDTVPEVPEHFSVVLSMTTPLAGVVLTPDNATVVINDDDGECSDS